MTTFATMKQTTLNLTKIAKQFKISPSIGDKYSWEVHNMGGKAYFKTLPEAQKSMVLKAAELPDGVKKRMYTSAGWFGGFLPDEKSAFVLKAFANILAIHDLNKLKKIYEKGLNDLNTYIDMYDEIESGSEVGKEMHLNHMYMWDKNWWKKSDLESRTERIANITFVLVSMENPNLGESISTDIDFKGFHLICDLLKGPDEQTTQYLKMMREMLAEHIIGVQIGDHQLAQAFMYVKNEVKKNKKKRRKKAKKNRKKH